MPRRIDANNDLAVEVIYYEYTHGGRKLSAQYSWNVPYSASPI
ncbi:hypothetical protein M2132_001922 [Dysgonomonas sp. PH5-45]|nr:MULTISPECIES: hypothetical protein [unclassified Dysgonomonas]MDH6355577.1 hypothetical protein [Dysgonomonas sp. PH5-45]MDH6388474.1 hypothetical protein [Dysgonomonas sp. PH5-37]